MLTLTIPSVELYDEDTNTFNNSKEQILQLEHSLVSLSKWEAKWEKPFLTKDPRTTEEDIDYIRCMTLTQNVDQLVYQAIDNSHIQKVSEYIDKAMSATTIRSDGKGNGREVVTAEIIYYWMITLDIPFECQKWHLNRLLTLVNVCSVKNQPPEKMGRNEILQRNRDLNNARRKAMNSKG